MVDTILNIITIGLLLLMNRRPISLTARSLVRKFEAKRFRSLLTCIAVTDEAKMVKAGDRIVDHSLRFVGVVDHVKHLKDETLVFLRLANMEKNTIEAVRKAGFFNNSLTK